jgi:hypothetical protein
MVKDPAILRNSKDPRELVRMAKLYASSDEPADQAVLGGHLGTTDFLDRLDSPMMYKAAQPQQLRVAGIIRILMEKQTPAPRQTLVDLTDSKEFQSYDQCVPLLIRALAADRPASARTIAHWTKHADPESVYSDNVVEAIFLNRSRPALDLFERMMNDARHEDGYKYYWLRTCLLQQRNDPEVLKCCERMVIDSSIDPLWHEPVLEALFDFDPTWYLTCRKPRPPLRVLAGDEAKDSIERLAKRGLGRKDYVNTELPLRMKLALKEIGRDQDDAPADPNAGTP